MNNSIRPEGSDSAQYIENEASNSFEIARIRRARAVAKRSIMGDLTSYCDRRAKEIEADSPGVKRGTVSKKGQALAALAREIGDHIDAERAKIEVPRG